MTSTLDDAPGDRRADLLAAKIGDRLRGQGGDLLLAQVQRGELLPRKIELHFSFHEDRFGFQKQLLCGDFLLEQSLFALKKHILQIEVRRCGEILAFRFGDFAGVDNRDGFAARDLVSKALAHLFDDARDLGGDAGDFVRIGFDGGRRRDPARNDAGADRLH